MNASKKINGNKIANKKTVATKKAVVVKSGKTGNLSVSVKKRGSKSTVIVEKSINAKFELVDKLYPQIYSYIYEREPQDMAKIYEEHKNAVLESKENIQKISGFKLVNNKLIAVVSK